MLSFCDKCFAMLCPLIENVTNLKFGKTCKECAFSSVRICTPCGHADISS